MIETAVADVLHAGGSLTYNSVNIDIVVSSVNCHAADNFYVA